MSATGMQVRGWVERARAVAACLALGVTAPAAFAANPAGPSPAAPPVARRSAAAAPADASSAWARAYAQGRWHVASTLLEAVPEASRSGWQWLHLARARSRQGLLVEAFDAYERLRELERPGRAGSALRELQRQARVEANGIENRIPWAHVELTGAAPPGTFVYVDQTWLEPARLRSPYPVNPGWHTFLLESEGRVLAARRVHFSEGQTQHITLRGLAPSRTSSASGELESEPSRSLAWSGAQGQAPVLEEEPSPYRTATSASLVAGAAGLALGATFGVAAAYDGDSEVAVKLANASVALGGVGLLTAGVLHLIGRHEAPAAQLGRVRVEARLGLGSAGVAGRF